jgi:ubiquinone/menaquinone biosynthesis C-methylase UbiE
MGEVLAALYDPLIAPLDPMGLRRFRQWAVQAAWGRVLELGVGTGLNLRYYRDTEAIAAIDPDGSSLRRAYGKAGHSRNNISLYQASAEALPFADESFDVVLGTLVFCTIPDPARALGEAKRVLKPGGTLRLVEHVRAPKGPVAWLQIRATPAWKQIAGGCHLDRDTALSVVRAGFQVRAVCSRLGGVLVGIDAVKS